MLAIPTHIIRVTALAVWLVLLPGLVSANALEKIFAPKAESWPRWVQYAENDNRQIPHDTWGSFLKLYAERSDDGVVRFDYARVTVQDRALLDDYISALSSLRISGYSRAEQFAYWVNLYNALTVQVVLDHYPVKSIRDIDISPGLFADGPWRKKLVEVEAEPLGLDDIEHRILRPGWGDPRIHYAVNCASIGCPNLQLVPFTAANSEQLLDRAARDYINHPRAVSVDERGLGLSSIYNWFEADFTNDGGVLGHLEQYADADLLNRIDGIVRVRGYSYDWTLNDASVEGS